MGADIYINCSCCENTVFEVSYTHNIVNMTHAALNTSHYTWSEEYQGKKASEIAPLLENLITVLEKDPERYRAMNPENGWGSYDGMMIHYLKPFLRACKEYPDGVLDFSV